jgi:uncharacterized protein
MNGRDIFFNEFGRLRSGWRFLVFQLLVAFLVTAVGAAAGWILPRLAPLGGGESSLFSFIFPRAVMLFLALFGGWLCGRFLEDLPFRALGAWFTKNWLNDLTIGLLLGAASVATAVLIAAAFGGMRLELNRTVGSSAILLTLGSSLAVFIVGAAAEEAYFRGYMLQTFARARLAWLAIAFTSVFFASAHFDNPNSNLIATLNTALAGVWLGVAYLKTRTLWLAFGIHLAWNWFLGAIFGIPVSGITELTTAPLMRQTETGADLIGGGAYGVEGGLACTLALIASTALIYFLPLLKPTEEMLALTNQENPATMTTQESDRGQ